MDNGTTNIDSLPISHSHNSHNNIKLEMNDSVQNNIPQNVRTDNQSQNIKQMREEDPSVNQRNLNQFVTGLQQASASGMTGLPSRDIPQNQDHLTQDVQIQPNFIPSANSNMNTDYILNHQTSEDIITQHNLKQKKQDSLDDLYNELQIPLLIAVIYFMFQLPVVRKNIFKYIPSVFHKDGNYNLYGFILNSVMFAGFYFLTTKGIKHFI